MDILKNELVQKYFGCPYKSPHWHTPTCEMWDAYRILAAMQEDIGQLVKYLYVERADHIYVTHPTKDADLITGFHPNRLRLPDRFQPESEKKEHCCVVDICVLSCLEHRHPEPPTTPVCEHEIHGVGCECGKSAEKCAHGSVTCGCGKTSQNEAVDGRINRIVDMVVTANIGGVDSFKRELRALVALARGGK